MWQTETHRDAQNVSISKRLLSLIPHVRLHGRPLLPQHSGDGTAWWESHRQTAINFLGAAVRRSYIACVALRLVIIWAMKHVPPPGVCPFASPVSFHLFA